MKATSVSPEQVDEEHLKGIPYEDTTPDKSPILIKTASPPRFSQARRTLGSQKRGIVNGTSPYRSSLLKDERRRDSGLATSNSTARDSRTTLASEPDTAPSTFQSPSIRIIHPQDDKTNISTHQPEQGSTFDGKPIAKEEPPAQCDPAACRQSFLGISTEIPTGSFDDLTMPGQVEFSKRGSLLIGGRRANKTLVDSGANGQADGEQADVEGPNLRSPAKVPYRVLSATDEALSRKVRSMYQDVPRTEEQRETRLVKANHVNEDTNHLRDQSQNARSHQGAEQDTVAASSQVIGTNEPVPAAYGHAQIAQKDPNERAGGIEDWQDLHYDEIDRYGFIVPRKFASQPSSLHSGRPASPAPPRLQRVSTLLQMASDTPRRKPSGFLSARSAKSPSRSAETNSIEPPNSRVVRPMSSQSSYRSSKASSRLRFATNQFPHNKDRRCVDEAGDMLTLPPGLADIAEDQADKGLAYDMRKREWEREEKWRKMGNIVRNDKRGGGMVFEFDTKSNKLIERTWKGIPDRWRASAWHSFMTTSARSRKTFVPDETLISVFKSLLDQDSSDDVQIDIDVPRTVNSHIMFRRRYRGGQRLLFRVLHCVSIYFPDTGYVQGMAALAATLLCYYDEEMAFVMMVRLWQLRGLDKLYQPGFAGLMLALEEFERDWLREDEVASKLSDLGVPPTSYGTRWYLTLFNYSIPFPAQLRVWDVFMLLGDPHPTFLKSDDQSSFNGGLDVLHACSAALIDGTREILLDSDFENAMKVLTSWIPIKDEELMMRVAKIEWKMKRRKDGRVGK